MAQSVNEAKDAAIHTESCSCHIVAELQSIKGKAMTDN